MKYTRTYTITIALFSMILTAMVVIATQEHTPFIDKQLVDLVQPLAQTPLYNIAHWVTKLSSKIFLIPFTMIVSIILLWRYQDWLAPLLFAGGTLMSHILNQLLKHIIQRERPSIVAALDATGYSFPSGHAMISIVCYGLFLYFLLDSMLPSKNTIIFKLTIYLLILCIGLSRVMLNVHYITDVIAGFMFGFLLLIGCQKLYETIQRQRGIKKGT